MIDRSTVSTSFTANKGLLTAEEDITIIPPTNFADDAVYDFIFAENSMVPLGSFFRIIFPTDVSFDKVKILSLESCDPTVTQCTLDPLNDRAIIIKTIA